MLEIDLKVDNLEGIKARLGRLRNQANRVMANASNRAAITGRKVIKQETTKIYLVRAKDVEQIAKIEKASSYKPYASIVYKDSHINLAHWPLRSRNLSPYKVIQFEPGGYPNVKVYKANVSKETGKRELGGDRKPFLQIAKKSGNVALFRRTGRGSEIEGVSGPAFPQIINNPEVRRRFEKETGDMLSKRVEHEIDFMLATGGKYKRGGKR